MISVIRRVVLLALLLYALRFTLAVGEGVVWGMSAGRRSANESMAIGNLRALTSSLEMHREVKGVYPMRWTEMYPGRPADFGPPVFKRAGEALSSFDTSGYLYTYKPHAGHWYVLFAVPKKPGKTGDRSFVVDQSGMIRHCIATPEAYAVNHFNATIDQPPTRCGNV